MKRPTVKEMFETFTLDEKELLDYGLESVKEYGCVIPRSPMDYATYISMSKDQKWTFEYVLGCQVEKHGWR